MSVSFEIISSSRNKVVLGLRKEQFIHIKYATAYSKTNALNLGILATAAYLPDVPIEEFLFKQQNSESRSASFLKSENTTSCVLADCNEAITAINDTYDFVEIPETDTQMFHYSTKDYLLFSFRGTFELVDWKTNLNASLIPFPEGVGKIHEGFYRAFKSIQSVVDRTVPLNDEKPVICCGHSLGGALATLAATYIRKKYQRKVMLYTYGSPLVGDSKFVHHFTNVEPVSAFRIVHNRDLVTMIPPPHSNLRVNLLYLGLVNPVFLIPATYDPFGKPFTHFGKVVFIRRIDDGKFFSVDVDRKTPAYLRIPDKIQVKEDRPKWDTVLNWALGSVEDHSMTRYVSILASDLKFAIDSYLEASALTIENTQKIIDYLDAEIKAAQKRRDAVEKEQLAQPYGVIPSDATATNATQSGRQTPLETLHLAEDVLKSKQMELMVQRSALAAMRTPAYSKGLLKDIIDVSMTPALKREFEYQSKHIKY